MGNYKTNKKRLTLKKYRKMASLSFNQPFNTGFVVRMTHAIDLNDYKSKSQLLDGYKQFFLKQIDLIKKAIFPEKKLEDCSQVGEALLSQSKKYIENQDNFFLISMDEPKDWILTGMRLGLAFVNDDKDSDLILTVCPWNDGTGFSIKKMSEQKCAIIKQLKKICNDPINMLSMAK